MKSFTIEVRPLAWLLVAALVLVAAGTGYVAGRSSGTASSGDMEKITAHLQEHPESIEKIVRDYLRSHPEVLGEMMSALLKKGATDKPTEAAAALGGAAAIATHAQALFNSPHQVTLGNPQGDVTLVEFFDYNCGYCRHALPDLLALLEQDPKLKIVLKEFPVLGESSVDMARIAIAVRMQDKTGAKYLAFHKQLLEGHASPARAKEIAKSLGLDMEKLEQDIASKEAADTLDESRVLASALSINGTPSYVVGKDVLAGAIGLEALKERIAIARQK